MARPANDDGRLEPAHHLFGDGGGFVPDVRNWPDSGTSAGPEPAEINDGKLLPPRLDKSPSVRSVVLRHFADDSGSPSGALKIVEQQGVSRRGEATSAVPRSGNHVLGINGPEGQPYSPAGSCNGWCVPVKYPTRVSDLRAVSHKPQFGPLSKAAVALLDIDLEWTN